MNHLAPYREQKAVLEAAALKRYVRGSSPLLNATEALDVQTLLTAWKETNGHIDAGLAILTAEALDGPAL